MAAPSKSPQRGGRRPNAGRKHGSGPYGEATRPLRVPVSQVETIRAFLSDAMPLPAVARRPCPLPLFNSPVRAGFPSPADDYVERDLDLNEHLIQHPAATFYVRAQGDSMIGAGIHDNDLLMVDRAIKPSGGKIVIAVVNGEFTVKRLVLKGKKAYLEAGNPEYPNTVIDEDAGIEIWGVVTNVIHKL
jgi:DNA polymerase V